MIIKFLDIMALCLTIPALYMLGNKNRNSFILFTLINIGMAYISIEKGLYGILMMQFIYAGFNIRNYIKWKKQN